MPVSQVPNKERTFREVQGRVKTTLLWLPSTDSCLFFNISYICFVYPSPTRTLWCYCKLKDKHGFVSSKLFFLFSKSVSAILILDEFFHQIFLTDLNSFVMHFCSSEIPVPQNFFYELRTWYKIQKLLGNKMCIGLTISTFNSSGVSFLWVYVRKYVFRGWVFLTLPFLGGALF